MKSVRNTTLRPLRVPLPRGKKLHLGPGKVGEIPTPAADHAPLLALVEAGDLEILGEGERHMTGSTAKGGGRASIRGHRAGPTGQRGDR